MSTIDHAGPVPTDEAEADSSVTGGCSPHCCPREPVTAQHTPTTLADLVTAALEAAGLPTSGLSLHLSTTPDYPTISILRQGGYYTREQADAVAAALGVSVDKVSDLDTTDHEGKPINTIEVAVAEVRVSDKPLRPKTRARIQSGLVKFLRPIGSTVPPMLVPAGGTWNETAALVDSPMRTRTTRDTDALVVPPFIAELRGGGSDARAIDDPLSTVTASGNHHALTVPDDWDAWAAVYSYVNRSVRGLDEPLPTLTTVVQEAILAGSHQAPDVDSCWLRMLEPYEAAWAQEFPRAYVLLGNKREQMRLAGNAVSVNAGRDLVSMVAESITGEPVDRAA